MQHKKTHVISDSYTRLDNATAYTALDALSNAIGGDEVALEFEQAPAHGNNRGWIINAICKCSSNQTVLPQIKLYIFDSSVTPTATPDNTEFGLTDADLGYLRGIINFTTFEEVDPTAAGAGNSVSIPNMAQPIGFELRTGNPNNSLWGLSRVENAYTPVAEETFTFELHIEQD